MAKQSKQQKKDTIDLRDDQSNYRDVLPEDLDITRAHAAYNLPNMTRRRIYAFMCLLVGAACVIEWLWRSNAVLVNNGFIVLGISLLATGAIIWSMGWPLNVRETEAITNATGAVAFPIGHVAAQLGWRGMRSRPTWRVLLYSYENPPKERGVVLVDGVDGSIVFEDSEANPEDWSNDVTKR